MKPLVLIFTLFIAITSCQTPVDKESIKNEIFETEKAFEAMASEKSISEAFYHFAADSAVIKRENDTLIIGKENIRNYYAKRDHIKATANWIPDFIDVSDCGTLAYTYGHYAWKIENENGEVTEHKGVFHTVWKKQENGSWRYVWD